MTALLTLATTLTLVGLLYGGLLASAQDANRTRGRHSRHHQRRHKHDLP